MVQQKKMTLTEETGETTAAAAALHFHSRVRKRALMSLPNVSNCTFDFASCSKQAKRSRDPLGLRFDVQVADIV